MTKIFEPSLDRILVRPIVETQSKGGVLLPKLDRTPARRNQQLPTQFGEVVAVGPGPRLDNGEHCDMGIKVGDTVSWCCAIELAIELGDEKYIVIEENALLGIVKDVEDTEGCPL
jgi:chaperonin GroES